MIVDLILESCVAGDIGARLALQHDRAAVWHDQAGPDQQDTRLPKRNLAFIDPYQPRPLRYEKETSGWAVEYVFGNLGRDLCGRSSTKAAKGRRGRPSQIHHLEIPA